MCKMSTLWWPQKLKRHGTFNNASLVFAKYLVSIVCISLSNKYIRKKLEKEDWLIFKIKIMPEVVEIGVRRTINKINEIKVQVLRKDW